MSDALKCANCKTERFDVYRRGYCHRCYELVRRKEQVERWDCNDPTTLKRLPAIAHQIPWEFPRIKADTIRELQLRLDILRSNEELRTGRVKGIDIEYALKRLAKHSGGKEEVIGNLASAITYHFPDPEQRRFLLGVLLNIKESRRWNPKEYWHALHPEEVERMMAQNPEDSAVTEENSDP